MDFKLKSKFAKIFVRLTDDAPYQFCLVGYGKKDWTHDYLGPKLIKHFLYLNLWFVDLQMEWLQIAKRKPDEQPI